MKVHVSIMKFVNLVSDSGKQDVSEEERARARALIPRVRNSATIPYPEWVNKYEDFIDSIFACVCKAINRTPLYNDSQLEELRERLSTYLYKTSINRYTSFDFLE